MMAAGMSRFFDLVSKPARDMGTTNVPGATPAALERRAPLLNPLINLDSNENPFGPSAQAIDAMRSVLSAAGSYPDDDCSSLRLKAGYTSRAATGAGAGHRGLNRIAEPAVPDTARAWAERCDQRALVHCVLDGGAGGGRASDRSAHAQRQF